ncbi:transposase [Streptomyces puniciscabiei]|uniref:transposase n=1 Tax=Streptomyces puniciscabiei TaxID=164348 RepID=UPI00332CB475
MVDDGLWVLIEPLRPPWPQKAPGPRLVDDRLCLQGILYGFGSGETCWRRLGRWHEAGVFGQLHRLLAELHAADELDWSRACMDASHRATGPSPVDRGKTVSKRHMICDGRGPPFKVTTTAADVNEVTQTLAVVERLAVRWERRLDLHDALIPLTCSLISGDAS